MSEHVEGSRHAGRLDGASAVGKASGGNRLLVEVGVWLDHRGRLLRARWRASTCASLIAYAEAACALLEARAVAAPLDRAVLLAEVAGVHPSHLDRADLVLAAIARAVAAPSTTRGASP